MQNRLRASIHADDVFGMTRPQKKKALGGSSDNRGGPLAVQADRPIVRQNRFALGSYPPLVGPPASVGADATSPAAMRDHRQQLGRIQSPSLLCGFLHHIELMRV